MQLHTFVRALYMSWYNVLIESGMCSLRCMMARFRAKTRIEGGNVVMGVR